MTDSSSSSSVMRSPTLAEIYVSARLPLVAIFVGAAFWLVVSSLLGLVASLQFHKPQMFANHVWLLYGRVRPAANDAFLYGFCLPAAVGVALWLLARLGRTLVAQPLLILVGSKLWNLGVVIGIIGILAGDGSGFENFDMPVYAAPFLFLGFSIMAAFALVTFHGRVRQELYPSLWFLLAGLFWFVWIFSTAALLLLAAPARGMAQAVTTWWYSNNLQVVCFGLFGIGILFYFILRLTRQNLRSRPLALLSFWFLMLLGSWGGIPNSAPVPAWMPTLSSVATVLMIVPLIAVGMNVYAATRKAFPKPYFAEPAVGEEGRGEEAPALLKFFSAGLLALLTFTAFNAMVAFRSGPQPFTFGADVTDFTWFVVAKGFLNNYGFFAMALFGAVYYILPTLFPGEKQCPKLVRIHFGFAALGVLFTVVPLGIGGIVQGFELQKGTAFADISKHTLVFLRVATLGDLLLLGGHVVFLMNVGGLVCRFYRARAAKAFSEATATVIPAGGQV